jgi:hypothetical protein
LNFHDPPVGLHVQSSVHISSFSLVLTKFFTTKKKNEDENENLHARLHSKNVFLKSHQNRGVRRVQVGGRLLLCVSGYVGVWVWNIETQSLNLNQKRANPPDV